VAAREGHEAVVEALLGRADVNSDMADLTGETALSQALGNGHEAIVKLLSERKNSILQSNGDKSAAPSLPESLDPCRRSPKRIRRR